MSVTDPAVAGATGRATSPETVARHIRGLIVSGDLRRGDRVPRDEIAARLGVSPIPVREAIIALNHEGWLTVEPHRGAFVATVDEEWVSDHYQILGAMYALIAGHAASRATEAEIAALDNLGTTVRRERDLDAFDAGNARFMRLLIDIARAPRLESALRVATNIVPGNFFVEVPGTDAPQRRAIRAVAQAVAVHDADTAASTLRDLSTRQGAAVVAVLRARGVIEPRTGR